MVLFKDWNIFVYESSFWERLKKLEEEIALRQGMKRGWFTYTELKYLITTNELSAFINNLVSLSAILAATYAAGILTIAASVFLTSRLPGTSLYKNTGIMPANENIINDQMLNNKDYSIPEPLSENRTHKSTSPVTVLNTSFLIVSMLTCNERALNCNKTDDLQDDENVSWDWWNNSLMIWLSDISRISDNNGKWTLPDNYYRNFANDKLLDMSIANQKILKLEGKIHKATKVRLQEQIERSWHEEWTDTIYTTFRSL